jgi:hypothetical protein
MRARRRLDQLRGDAHPAAGFAYRTFKDIADAQFMADLLRIDGMALGR